MVQEHEELLTDLSWSGMEKRYIFFIICIKWYLLRLDFPLAYDF